MSRKAPLPPPVIESILVEWRAAEVVLADELTDDDLATVIEALRAEHAAAVEARRAEASDLEHLPATRLRIL